MDSAIITSALPAAANTGTVRLAESSVRRDPTLAPVLEPVGARFDNAYEALHQFLKGAEDLFRQSRVGEAPNFQASYEYRPKLVECVAQLQSISPAGWRAFPESAGALFRTLTYFHCFPAEGQAAALVTAKNIATAAYGDAGTRPAASLDNIDVAGKAGFMRDYYQRSAPDVRKAILDLLTTMPAEELSRQLRFSMESLATAPVLWWQHMDTYIDFVDAAYDKLSPECQLLARAALFHLDNRSALPSAVKSEGPERLEYIEDRATAVIHRRDLQPLTAAELEQTIEYFRIVENRGYTFTRLYPAQLTTFTTPLGYAVEWNREDQGVRLVPLAREGGVE